MCPSTFELIWWFALYRPIYQILFLLEERCMYHWQDLDLYVQYLALCRSAGSISELPVSVMRFCVKWGVSSLKLLNLSFSFPIFLSLPFCLSIYLRSSQVERKNENENFTILIPKGNLYCRRKSSPKGPLFKVSCFQRTSYQQKLT